MNIKLRITCTIIIMLALGGPVLADDNSTVVVHGTAYNWDTLEPLDNVVIHINSTPPQSWVAKNGMYSFELLPGNYTITANCYQNSILTYSVEETMQIIDGEDNVNYVYDLMLFPVSSEEPNIGSNMKRSNENNSSNGTYLQIGLITFILLSTGYIFYRKYRYSGKKTFVQEEVKNYMSSNSFKNSVEQVSPAENLTQEPVHDSKIHPSSLKNRLPLPPDLQEVINIIRANRGRIPQKDLRTKLKQSEVKVSLLLSDLEKRDLIKKIKSGRENLVILTDEEY